MGPGTKARRANGDRGPEHQREAGSGTRSEQGLPENTYRKSHVHSNEMRRQPRDKENSRHGLCAPGVTPCQAVGAAFLWVFSVLGGLSLCPTRGGRLSCVRSSVGSLQPLLRPVCRAPSPGTGTRFPWTLRVEPTSLALCIVLQNLLLGPDHLTELPFYFMLRSFVLKMTIDGRVA